LDDGPATPAGRGTDRKTAARPAGDRYHYPEVAEKIRTEADYFERNAERMRYPKFRRQHLFIGSGVIEAGCKTVIGFTSQTVRHVLDGSEANAVLALRSCHLNGWFEDYWEARRA